MSHYILHKHKLSGIVGPYPTSGQADSSSLSEGINGRE